MPRRRTANSGPIETAPATTVEGFENQMIADAMALAAKQIREGTASSQVITHFLKAGSTRERLEQQKLYYENALLEEKRKAFESQQRSEEMYAQAMKAFAKYSGQDDEEYDDGFD